MTPRKLSALITRIFNITGMLRHGSTRIEMDGQEVVVLLEKGFMKALKDIESDVETLQALIPDDSIIISDRPVVEVTDEDPV